MITALTLQEIFDKTALHLLTQNEKSASLGGHVCAYRGENSRMCAAGVHIKDEYYIPSLEGHKITGFPVLEALKSSGAITEEDITVTRQALTNAFYPPRIRLLDQLQEVHDWSRPLFWRRKLIEVAHELSLNPDVVHNFKKSKKSDDVLPAM